MKLAELNYLIISLLLVSHVNSMVSILKGCFGGVFIATVDPYNYSSSVRCTVMILPCIFQYICFATMKPHCSFSCQKVVKKLSRNHPSNSYSEIVRNEWR